MKIRPVAVIALFVSMVSVAMGVVFAQGPQGPLAPGEYYNRKWARFQFAAQKNRLDELVQSLNEYLDDPSSDPAYLDQWQQLLTEFQDVSEQFISLNQAYYDERRNLAEETDDTGAGE